MITLDPSLVVEPSPHAAPDPALVVRDESDCVGCASDGCPVCVDHASLIIELL